MAATPNDDALLRLIRQGDETAYAHLRQRFAGPIRSALQRFSLNDQDIEDVIQETFISCWKNVGQFKGDSSLNTWLSSIAINAALSKLRAKRVKKASSLDDAESIHAQPPIESPLEVWEAVAELPTEFSEVVIMRYAHELSSKDIAFQLKISDALVRQRLHRARSLLATSLQPILCPDGELTCGGNTLLLLAFIDGVLDDELVQPVAAHIEACLACQNARPIHEQVVRYLSLPNW